MLYCLSLYAQLTISYMLCTYWLSGKAGQDDVWLEVMTYEPPSVISYHYLMAGGLCFNWLVSNWKAHQTECLTKLNGSPNWMAHQIEWLTKLNGSLSNRMTHYRMAHQIELLAIEWPTKPNESPLSDSLSLSSGSPRIECRAVREEPGLYSAPAYRRRDFLKLGVFRIFPCFVYPRIQNSYVFGFPSGARYWGKSHGIQFWLGRGPKIISCSR